MKTINQLIHESYHALCHSMTGDSDEVSARLKLKQAVEAIDDGMELNQFVEAK